MVMIRLCCYLMNPCISGASMDRHRRGGMLPVAMAFAARPVASTLDHSATIHPPMFEDSPFARHADYAHQRLLILDPPSYSYPSPANACPPPPPPYLRDFVHVTIFCRRPMKLKYQLGCLWRVRQP